MRILITNDDGIFASGLWVLAKSLSSLGSITVVAPDREQSATGTAISLLQPIRVRQISSEVTGVLAYAVEGYPCDSVILGLEKVIDDRIDVVISGINRGLNVGDDVFISGTVGAAMQAYFRGLPAIAISAPESTLEMQGEVAGVVEKLCTIIGAGRLSGSYLLNMNFPQLPLGRVKGIIATRLAHHTHINTAEEGSDHLGRCYWLRREQLVSTADPGTDIWALEQGYVSLTALHRVLFSQNEPVIEGVCLELGQELSNELNWVGY